MGFRPSAGEEIQSEFQVPREHALDAIAAIRGLADRFAPLVQVIELRMIAADRLWMSPQYERDTVGMHFTWVRDQEAVERALALIEPALAPFDARPHWGKAFLGAPRYPRHDDFVALVERYDPRGAFRNDWFSAALGLRPAH
jgi:xylitol oxidase